MMSDPPVKAAVATGHVSARDMAPRCSPSAPRHPAAAGRRAGRLIPAARTSSASARDAERRIHDANMIAVGRRQVKHSRGPATAAAGVVRPWLLERGAHSILDLLPEVRVAEVPFAVTEHFFNVNTPADWERARRLAAADAPLGPARPPAVLGVIGRRNSGKTTLIERLLPEFARRGVTVATVKSVAHFDVDTPGKDSWRHGEAGAETYAVASASKLAFVTRLRAETTLAQVVERCFAGYDLVVCEGYRREAPHVIEVFRAGAGYADTRSPPEELLALVTDVEVPHPHRFALDDAAGLAAFLVEQLGL